MKKYKKHVIALVLGWMLLGTASAGMTYAYLSTDPGTRVNVFTVGDIEIELSEEHWKPEEAGELHPGEKTGKDPVIQNTGLNDAYVFLEVAVPMRDFSIVNEEGIKTDRSIREIFVYEADLDAWELIDHSVKSGKSVCVYGYRDILQPDCTTSPLFTDISTVPYLEGSLNAEEIFTVEVTAKAIQNRFGEEQLTLPEIYAEFVQQTKQGSETEHDKYQETEAMKDEM